MTALLVPAVGQAACSTSAPGGAPIIIAFTGFDPGALNPTVAEGSILMSRSVNLSSVGGSFTCYNDIGVIWYRGVTTFEPTYRSYTTAIPGMGIRFKFTGSTLTNYWPVTQDLTGLRSTTVSQQSQLIVELIKTGPIFSGGIITGEVGGWFAMGNTSQVVSIRVNGNIQVNPQMPTCSVTTPSIMVPFGAVSAKTFTGVGSTSPAKPFNIGLSCAGGAVGITTNVYATLTDQTNPANNSNTLSLTADSSARGIGIQVLNQNGLISYGPASTAPPTSANSWLAGSTGNGVFNIPLTARYVQTAPTVTPGSANGRATFTMSYQ